MALFTPLTRALLRCGFVLLGAAPLTHANIGTNGWPNHVIDAYDYPCQHNQDGFEGADDCTTCGGDSAFGLVRWRVSEPYLTLWLHDVPFAYSPSQGPPIAARLSYKHRGNYANRGYSSFGTNWGCHWFGYVEDDGTNQVFVSEGAALPFQAGSVVTYKFGVATQKMINGFGQTTGYRLWFGDGSRDEYTKASGIAGGPTHYLLKFSYDQHGFITEFRYGNLGAERVVRQIIDCDGKTNVLSYAHAITNLVTSIQDPYGRIAQFQYDSTGRLTNILDVATNSSVLTYDASGVVTNLTTPYGNTSFKITQSAPFQDPNNTNRWVALGGTNVINRSIEITQPGGSKQLYLYRDDSRKLNPTSGVDLLPASFPLPSTGSFSNKFEDSDLFYRNSFHWNRQQYEAISSAGKVNYSNMTTNDYLIATLKHWLGAVSTNGETLSDSVSMIRAASPDGYTAGQMTWHDYAGQADSHHEGTNAAARFAARILPDNTSWFERAEREEYGNPTNVISTYSVNGAVAYRTNDLKYAGTFKQVLTELSLREGAASTVLMRAAYSLNGGNQLLLITNAVGEVTTNKYDGLEGPGSRLTNIFRASGLATKIVYYSGGDYDKWIQQIVDYTGSYTAGASSNRVRSFTYTNGLVHTYTDPRGLTVTNTWDALQRLTSVAFTGGVYLSNRYDKLDLIASRDRLGQWTYFGYDALQRLTAITNANGVVTRYGYCDCGSVESVTNAWNTTAELVTSSTHDYQGNRTHLTLPDATLTNWFDAVGRVSVAANGQGYRAFLYNNQGLVTNISDALGTEQALVYDLRDRPIYVTDANGVTVTNTFDNLNRLLTRTYPGGAVERYSYSARGLIAYTNQLGQPTLYGRDAFGRVTSVTNANQETLFYTYNPAGDLLKLKDGKAQVTAWNYDEHGRATNKLDQAGVEVLRYKYDPSDRLTNRWSKAKGDTKYSYDPVGNLTNINYSSSPDVTLRYDWLNRLTNLTDTVGTTKFAYAAGGQLLTEDGPWNSDTITHGYLNRLRTSLSLQQPIGTWTNGFRYDAAWRLTNVTSQAGSFDYLHAYASPLPLKLSLPNTAYITNTYDTVARLLGTWLKKNDQTTLNSHEYVYNPGNQRTQQVFNAGSTYNYNYDPIGQLKVADSATASEDRGYTYDTAWNLNYRTNNGVLGTFTVDGKNQLTSALGGSCTYDNNGNLTISHGERRSYVYDDENRLVELYVSTSPFVLQNATEFLYDGLGRLRIRREYSYVGAPEGPSLPDSPGSDWQLDSETRYVYDRRRVIQERDGNNTPLVSYTRGKDLSGSLEGAGGIGGLLARSHGYSAGNWSTHNFYHADGGGNITYLVNSSQALAASYRYDPYGNLISSSGSLAGANVYRFSSKEQHAVSGLYYYGARFYEPNLQRWLNRDPLGEWGGINLYGFVGNSPMGFVDPLGLLSTKDFNPGLMLDLEVYQGIWSLLAGYDGTALPLNPDSYRAKMNQAGLTPGVLVDEEGNSFTGAQLVSVGAGAVTALVLAEAVDAYNPLDEVSDLNKLRKCKKATRKIPKGFDPSKGFKSFDDFKNALGAAGPGHAWHHAVEQTINSGKFAPELLHNPANLFKLPHGKGSIHAQISGFYSSKVPGVTGNLTVREWLSQKSFKEQFEFGIDAIKAFGGAQYLPPHLR